MKNTLDDKLLSPGLENEISQPPLVEEGNEIKDFSERKDMGRDFVPTVNDIEKWQRGFENYKSFRQDMLNRGENPDDIFTELRKREIQAVFLGEKPVSNFSEIDFSRYKDELLKYGLIGINNPNFPNEENDYFYSHIVNPETLSKKFQEKKDIFKENGYNSAAEIIKTLEADVLGKKSTKLYGIILGYPEKATQEFADFRNTYSSELTKNELPDMYMTDSDARILYDFYYQEPGITLKQATDSLKSLQPKLHLTDNEIEIIANQELPILTGKKFIDIEGINWVQYSPDDESDLIQQRLRYAFKTADELEKNAITKE